jgi:hypothetical protein
MANLSGADTTVDRIARFTATFTGAGFAGKAADAMGLGITPSGVVIIRWLAAYVETSLGFARAGTATAIDATTLTTDAHAGTDWAVNEFAGAVVTVGASTATIVSNTATVLTFVAWVGGTPAPDAYSIAFDGTGATAELGLVGATTAFIAATAATLLTAGKIWSTATPNAVGIVKPSTSADFIRASADVGFPTLTPRVHDITSGVIRGAIGWEPVSAGAYLAGAA